MDAATFTPAYRVEIRPLVGLKLPIDPRHIGGSWVLPSAGLCWHSIPGEFDHNSQSELPCLGVGYLRTPIVFMWDGEGGRFGTCVTLLSPKNP